MTELARKEQQNPERKTQVLPEMRGWHDDPDSPFGSNLSHKIRHNRNLKKIIAIGGGGNGKSTTLDELQFELEHGDPPIRVHRVAYGKILQQTQRTPEADSPRMRLMGPREPTIDSHTVRQWGMYHWGMLDRNFADAINNTPTQTESYFPVAKGKRPVRERHIDLIEAPSEGHVINENRGQDAIDDEINELRATPEGEEEAFLLYFARNEPLVRKSIAVRTDASKIPADEMRAFLALKGIFIPDLRSYIHRKFGNVAISEQLMGEVLKEHIAISGSPRKLQIIDEAIVRDMKRLQQLGIIPNDDNFAQFAALVPPHFLEVKGSYDLHRGEHLKALVYAYTKVFSPDLMGLTPSKAEVVFTPPLAKINWFASSWS